MNQLEALELLEDVRADYIGMWRDNNGLRRLVNPPDPHKSILVERMTKAIIDLNKAFLNRKAKL